MEVSVSEEMVESGRIYSTLSANPTRARDGGRADRSSSESCFRNDGCDIDRLNLWPKAKALPWEGVEGALPVCAGMGGLMIEVRS